MNYKRKLRAVFNGIAEKLSREQDLKKDILQMQALILANCNGVKLEDHNSRFCETKKRILENETLNSKEYYGLKELVETITPTEKEVGLLEKYL